MSGAGLAILFFVLIQALYVQSSAAFQNPTATPISPYTATLYVNSTPTPENITKIDHLNELVNDPECLLPCWWGLTLGESDEEGVADMLNTYFDEDWSTRIDDLDEIKHKVFYGSFLTLPRTEETVFLIQEYGIFGTAFWLRENENRLVAGHLVIHFPEMHYIDWNPYLARTFLGQYGAPDEVQLVIYNLDILHPAQSSLFLRYHDLGLYVEYVLWTPYNGENVNICNSVSAVNLISIWVETPEMEFPTALKLARWDRIRFGQDYQTHIEDISGLTTEEFTELFSQEDACFDIPIEN
jgi:hypothetical protein